MNDLDCYLANFWRALQHDPDAVAYHADSPVNEADLHARHRWLVEVARPTAERCMREPDFYDPKIAGWWVWGQCLWIGSGWCQTVATKRNKAPQNQKRRPQLTNDQGIITRHENGASTDRVVDWKQRPDLTNPDGRGAVAAGALPRKRPNACGNGQGCGVHRRWQGGGQAGGSGVHAPRLTRQVPDLSGDSGAAGRGIHASAFQRSGGLYNYMRDLATRLRRVRVCCGDWSRVVTPAVTHYMGLTGVFLDPPYSHAEREICYAQDENCGAAVREWALANGDNPRLRIALCGYEGEHEMPDSWECIGWKAHGGYSRSERGKANRSKERIWFSPHCLGAMLPLAASE